MQEALKEGESVRKGEGETSAQRPALIRFERYRVCIFVPRGHGCTLARILKTTHLHSAGTCLHRDTVPPFRRVLTTYEGGACPSAMSIALRNITISFGQLEMGYEVGRERGNGRTYFL